VANQLFENDTLAQAALFISNADGSGERSLKQSGSLDYNPAWSPKDDWIAITSERAGSADLYRIHPDGTGLDRLTDDPAYNDQAAFSPEGKQIVSVTTRASGNANIWILDTATHSAKPLTSGRGGPAGMKLHDLFSDARSGVFLLLPRRRPTQAG